MSTGDCRVQATSDRLRGCILRSSKLPSSSNGRGRSRGGKEARNSCATLSKQRRVGRGAHPSDLAAATRFTHQASPSKLSVFQEEPAASAVRKKVGQHVFVAASARPPQQRKTHLCIFAPMSEAPLVHSGEGRHDHNSPSTAGKRARRGGSPTLRHEEAWPSSMSGSSPAPSPLLPKRGQQVRNKWGSRSKRVSTGRRLGTDISDQIRTVYPSSDKAGTQPLPRYARLPNSSQIL